jgi:3-methylcrotonyl-CoA carboxylase beta subunit
MSPAEQKEFMQPILDKYAEEGNAYYSTARLWDDGVIDPADTRRVLGMGLAVAAHAPVPAPSYGVFRM